MTTRLICFTRRAQAEPGARFNALMGLLAEPEGLRESFERQPGNKAPGVDGPDLAHAADALRWEPDGVTLHVRFCEGDGTYPQGIPAATLLGTAGACSDSLQGIWCVTWPSRFLETVPVLENRISHPTIPPPGRGNWARLVAQPSPAWRRPQSPWPPTDHCALVFATQYATQ